MEDSNWLGTVVNILAVSGGAAWVSAFTSNKRGGNKALDIILDALELVAGNVNKAKNASE